MVKQKKKNHRLNNIYSLSNTEYVSHLHATNITKHSSTSLYDIQINGQTSLKENVKSDV